jgi:hypothetical protein
MFTKIGKKYNLQQHLFIAIGTIPSTRNSVKPSTNSNVKPSTTLSMKPNTRKSVKLNMRQSTQPHTKKSAKRNTKSNVKPSKTILHKRILRLGSVAGPVIQATGRSEFEDGLGSGDLCVGLLISHECPH